MNKLIKYFINDLKNKYEDCIEEAKKSEAKENEDYATAYNQGYVYGYNQGYVYGYLSALLCTDQITEEEHNNVLTELGLKE